MIAGRIGQIGFAALLGCLGYVAAAAQGPLQPVSWSLAASPNAVARSGSHLTLDLTAHIEDGWHVYGLKHTDGGPTPLRISTDANSSLQIDGPLSGTTPTRRHDPSFDLDTEVFNHLFALHVPVLVTAADARGTTQIALNVRFQACNYHICLPPKTVHVTVTENGL